MSTVMYPLRVDARLDAPLSRWLWLVKWILAIPHFVVLAFLWMAFGVLSVVAFFSILFTTRYPRGIFEFNVGVLRWSWRVAYYTYAALGTDRYPPFTLDDDPEYPTHLEIAYPEHLSRGLVLVKWWLLAIPHYLIVAILAGGSWFAWRSDLSIGFSGVIGALAIVAALILAFTGRYPQGLFDVILGLNRWVLRVAAYTGLMTDVYPPFRLDAGGSEPGGASMLTVSTAPAPAVAPARAPVRWTGGQITAVVCGALMAMISIPVLGGGGVGLVYDRTQRDGAGYITLSTEDYVTDGYAITTEGVEVRFEEGVQFLVDEIVGTVRVRVTPADRAERMFVGVAAISDIESYLGDVRRARVVGTGRNAEFRTIGSDGPDTVPEAQSFWTTTSVGAGERSLVIPADVGRWGVVVMNADGTADVAVATDVAATVPNLEWLAVGALITGLVLLAIGVVLILAAAQRAARTEGG